MMKNHKAAGRHFGRIPACLALSCLVALAASPVAGQTTGASPTPEPHEAALADLPPLPTLPSLPPLPATGATAQDPNAIRVLLSPQLETTLVAPMNGRIDALRVSLGGKVAKGDTLVSFDCAEANARLRMSQAEHTAARETLDVKQRLHKLNAVGDTEVALARAEAARTTAAIAVSRAQLAHCTVAAPFNGYIVKIHVKPHQGVNIGSPLVELVSDGPLKLRLNVPSRLLRQLSIGSPLEVDILETGNTYPARIVAINARVDAVAQTIELEASLDESNPDLLPGMSGIARLPVKAP